MPVAQIGRAQQAIIRVPKGAYVQDQVQTGEPKEAKGAQKLDTREPKGAKAMLTDKNPTQQERLIGLSTSIIGKHTHGEPKGASNSDRGS